MPTSKLHRLLLLLFFLLVTSCGGGSAGTGTGDSGFTVTGTVRDETGAPVSEAIVTVLETGESVTTNTDGQFTFETEIEETELSLEIESNSISTTTTVSAIGEEGEAIDIEIEINPILGGISSSTLQVSAKIVGFCDTYFENRRTIRQANRVPDGTNCTAKVRVKSDGLSLAFVPIAIQYRACPSGSPWTTVALGATMTGGNLGIGEVTFPFTDSNQRCVYRIVAPFEVEGLKQIVYRILTFTKQSFDSRPEAAVGIDSSAEEEPSLVLDAV